MLTLFVYGTLKSNCKAGQIILPDRKPPRLGTVRGRLFQGPIFNLPFMEVPSTSILGVSKNWRDDIILEHQTRRQISSIQTEEIGKQWKDIHGEIFEATQKQVERIDLYEGVGYLYQRVMVVARVGGKVQRPVWVYASTTNTDRYQQQEIETGIWEE